jgi:hypothetical protein
MSFAPKQLVITMEDSQVMIFLDESGKFVISIDEKTNQKMITLGLLKLPVSDQDIFLEVTTPHLGDDGLETGDGEILGSYSYIADMKIAMWKVPLARYLKETGQVLLWSGQGAFLSKIA